MEYVKRLPRKEKSVMENSEDEMKFNMDPETIVDVLARRKVSGGFQAGRNSMSRGRAHGAAGVSV